MEIKFYLRIIYSMLITLQEYLTKEKVLKERSIQKVDLENNSEAY